MVLGNVQKRSETMAQQIKYCMKCGKQVGIGKNFCLYCGTKINAVEDAAVVAKTVVAGAAPQAISKTPEDTALTERINAASVVGEVSFDLGDIFGGTTTKAMDKEPEILSPFKTLISGAKSFGSNLVGIVKNPKAAIPVAVIAILWIVLGMMQDSDNAIVKFLSWLTYTKGGLNSSVLGTIGGILGKGVVAVAFATLFNGGLKDTAKGIKNLLNGFGKKNGEKHGIVSILIGIVIGTLCYFIFSGFSKGSHETSMVGISGVFLSLRAMGGKNGFAYELLESVTAKAENGIRTARVGKITGVLTGMTIGFAVVTVISSLFTGSPV